MRKGSAGVDGVGDPRPAVQDLSEGSPEISAGEDNDGVEVHTSLHSVFVNNEYFSGIFSLQVLHARTSNI